MDEVWNRKYEPGPIRDGDRFDPNDLCAYSAPGARTGLQSWCPTSTSALAEFQSGRSGPLEAPRQKLSPAYREQHNALLTEREIAPTTPRMGRWGAQTFRNLPEAAPAPSPSSRVAMHGVWGTAQTPLGRMTITYTTATHIIRGKQAESEL